MYDYNQLEKIAQTVKYTEIGQSVLHRKLFCFSLGTGPIRVLFHGAHHGLEQITTEVLMRFYLEFRDALAQQKEPFLKIAKRFTLDLIPMVNPDGVELALYGLSGENPYYYDLKEMLRGADPTQVWQANIRGVDLNHNYDAGFETSKALLKTHPGPTRYPGTHPESEPESHALAEWTRKRRPALSLSFHSQGEVLYYGYLNYEPQNAQKIGAMLADAAGYGLEKAEGVSSFGGYKDWYTKEFRRCGYTVEVGRGKNPLPSSDLPEIYRRVRPLLLQSLMLPTSAYQSTDRSDT